MDGEAGSGAGPGPGGAAGEGGAAARRRARGAGGVPVPGSGALLTRQPYGIPANRREPRVREGNLTGPRRAYPSATARGPGVREGGPSPWSRRVRRVTDLRRPGDQPPARPAHRAGGDAAVPVRALVAQDGGGGRIGRRGRGGADDPGRRLRGDAPRGARREPPPVARHAAQGQAPADDLPRAAARPRRERTGLIPGVAGAAVEACRRHLPEDRAADVGRPEPAAARASGRRSATSISRSRRPSRRRIRSSRRRVSCRWATTRGPGSWSRSATSRRRSRRSRRSSSRARATSSRATRTRSPRTTTTTRSPTTTSS